MIVVDGHLREECVRLALPRLAEGGAIVFDNSEGYGFREFTMEADLMRVDFYGFCSVGTRQSCTSLAFRKSCFLLDPANPLPQID